MNDNRVLLMVDEDVVIVSLYHDYMIRHNMLNDSIEETRMSVKAFSDYIQQYLIERYNLDEEETDA